MKLTADIVELVNEYDKFESHISDPAPRMEMETILVTSDTFEFDSRKQKEDEIISFLKDPSICIVGVWGMGGVGKTAIANKIRKRATEEKLLEETVMAAVSQQVIKSGTVQQELAEGLDLHLTQETVHIRAGRLHARLEDKKVLIILDDVCKPLNLEELGIPSQTKILLTTRNHGFCKSMSTEETTKILTLGVLNEEEAFFFFVRTLEALWIGPIFASLSNECGKRMQRLASCLVIVGRSLRGENNESIWKAFLGQLKKSVPTYIEGYLEGVSTFATRLRQVGKQ